MQPPVNLPPPIRTDGTNPFAFETMKIRHTKMIKDVLAANPDYPPIVAEELRLLREDLLRDAPVLTLNLFPTPAPDYIEWASAHVERGSMTDGENRPTWLSTDWFFAETMLFRLIVEAVRYPETRRDPFAPMKAVEVNSLGLWEMLERALRLPGGPHERVAPLLRMAMWGNRMDLSYAAAAEQGTAANDADTLADDAEAVRDHLLAASLASFPSGERGIIHLIADNAGTELAMDLVLVDTLLAGFCDVVILHTKFYPTFVSDATNADVLAMIDRFVDGPHGVGLSEPVTALGARLKEVFMEGRLRLAPNLFWNSPLFMWEMNRQLARVFDNSNLVIVKGDANYRRLVGDAIWEATLPFEQVVNYFPAPLVALRTLKSDPIIGLSAEQVETLDATDRHWRTNGQRGVIQLARL